MKEIGKRLEILREKSKNQKITIMILGLGSVGHYLLDYLLSLGDESLQIVVVGRNRKKMEADVNIVKVSSMIRRQNKTEVIIEGDVDFEQVGRLADCFETYKPDFIVNSSRVYSGLKYGRISWENVRAYGIWAPLAIKYIKNIMKAYEIAGSHAIVINTSYSDAVIPWLKSAGKAYPDFGSGNLNHLVPRMKLAVAEMEGIKDYWNIEVMLATGHFHDVVISKEGYAEGNFPLIKIRYQGSEITVDQQKLLSLCKIPMPVDSKRNMMNASSNYDIICSVLQAVREKQKVLFFSPGAFGEIGGYPVCIDGKEMLQAQIDNTVFSVEEMKLANRKSMALDGIEAIAGGCLVYTNELIQKTKAVFGVELPKTVQFEDIDKTASFLVDSIITPQINGSSLIL